MGTTYKLIQAQTVPSALSTITFSSIPQTYTDLNLLVSARTARSNHLDDLIVRLNGSSTGYTGKIIYTDSGSSMGSLNYSEVGFVTANNATSNTFGNMSIYIPNYTSSNLKSHFSDNVTENNATSVGMALAARLWSDTAAISSITISANANFMTNSTFYLYGIQNS
jgi:hypothetical protein